ncbi:unnamed protein product [Chironomus riparius]|uniref:G-protein coupled receptors family 1 profile domain-containing protein n=1 Tax=Chironomus riparius TaxID=315576 RepID=A0A9N9RIH8_9DIPT|nr:unnamed protein product [Chironomus riparius]
MRNSSNPLILPGSNASEDYEEFEMFYEYFDKRPIKRFSYITIMVTVTILGILLNSLIVFMKLRKFKERSIFEWLATCIAFGLIFNSVKYFLLMLSIVTHEITNSFTCYAEHVSGDFSDPMIIYSAVVLMIVTKFNPQISKTRGFLLILLIWIFVLFLSYPFYRITTIQTYIIGKTTVHNICIQFYPGQHWKSIINRSSTKLYLEFIIPSIIIAVYFLVTLLFQTPKVIKYLGIWTYVVIISTYFCLTSIPVKLNMLFFHNQGVSYMKYSYVYLNSLFMAMILVISPLVYFCCNQKFYEEIRKYFKFERRNENEFHEIFGDERIIMTV